MPVEVLAPGLVTGSLTGLNAMGLVLIHRSSRVINFAQANMGGFTGSLSVVLVAVVGWSWWVAVPFGLALSVLVGVWVERGLLGGSLRDSPRLTFTVATIGVALLLGGLTAYFAGGVIDLFGWFQVPHLFDVPTAVQSALPFRFPLESQTELSSLVLPTDFFIAVGAVPLVVIGLSWYFNRTDGGIGVRAAADSRERAVLLGLPVRRLTLLAWVVASVLSFLAFLLQVGANGFMTNAPSGPELLVIPLAAAVLARFESLTIALIASIGIGLIDRALGWSYPASPALGDVCLFVLIVVALLLRGRGTSRVGGEDLGDHVGLREVRPLTASVAALPIVRRMKVIGLVVLLLVATVWPLRLNGTQLTFLSFVAIFVVVAASLILLAGWGGQLSLGQFGFVGLGAGVTGWLMTSHHLNLLLCLLASVIVGALAALAIGLPALRIRGLYLAVVTMAFAVPASTFLLDKNRFPWLAPARVDPPELLDGLDLREPRPFYYFCLLVMLVALGVARNFRGHRIGRAAVALRDNERFAAGVSISATRVRLTTFAVSGGLAGLAGGLYVLAYRGIPYGGFPPVLSFQTFTMVVVGGIGSLWGALLGAIYVYGAQYWLGSTAVLLTGGAGILLVLRASPGGLADLCYRVRDALLRRMLHRDEVIEPDATVAVVTRPTSTAHDEPALLHLESVTAAYDHLQVLFGIDLDVRAGEIFAVLGTNGAGKSTTLRVIAGLLPANGGRVVFDGEDITNLSPAARIDRGIVLVSGGRGVFGSLTVADNLRLASWHTRRRGDAVFVARMTAQIDELFPILRARAGQRASLLSGGEQQMLTIAQALLCRPRLLLIDELSLGLAPVVVGQLLAALRRLQAEGMTIVLVEQSMNIAAEVAPRAVFIEKGAVQFAGATSELVSESAAGRTVFLAHRSAAASTPPTESPGSALPVADGTPDERPVVLETRGLRKTYGGVVAIDDVDLVVREHQILGVIGANGAGKTTLFDVICGFVQPDAGRVLLRGRDVTTAAADVRFAKGLGRTFQDLRLLPSMTTAEVLAVALERHIEVRDPLAGVLGLPAALTSEARVRATVDELLEQFSLQPYAQSFVSELSTGTRRIVELAAVYAHKPKVLVLDEPSSGLAQREAEAMIPLLFDLRERLGTTIAIIEHDIPMIRELSDEVVCMHLGGVLARGRADEVLADPAVNASYLGVDQVAVERSGAGGR